MSKRSTLAAATIAAAALAPAATAHAAIPPGPLFGWGANGLSQTSIVPFGSQINAPTPSAFGARSIQLNATPNQSLILQADGTVLGFGSNEAGELGDGTGIGSWTTNPQAPRVSLATGITQIAGNRHTALALATDGSVKAWGKPFQGGTLGDAASTLESKTPLTVVLPGPAVNVATSEYSRFVVLADGTIRGWGFGGNGLLGNGDALTKDLPTQVAEIGVTTPKALEVVGGVNFAAARLADGTVRAWGSNGNGQLGVPNGGNSLTPVAVAGITDVVDLDAGWGHIVALRKDGTVWSWGANDQGQLARGVFGTVAENHVPKPITGITDVSSITAGGRNTGVVKRDGTVWTWGFNHNGVLGDGTTTRRFTPGQIAGLRAVAFELSGPGNGDGHALAIAALPATVGPVEAALGRQLSGTIGAAKTITVTAGSLPLDIKRVALGEGDVDQFLVSREDCAGETLEPGETCEVRVRYAPSAAGAHAAALTVITTNGVPVPQGTVTGTGDLPLAVLNGRDGADGLPGRAGDAGPAGTPGAAGAKGEGGAAGPAGAAGKDGATPSISVSCKLTNKRTKVACTVKSKARVTASLRVAGRATAKRSGRSITVTLTTKRPVKRGTKVVVNLKGSDPFIWRA